MTDERAMSLSNVVDPGRPAFGSVRFAVAVRRVINAALRRASDQDMQQAAALVCRLARNERIPIERVLVVVRSEWETADKSELRLESGEAMRARVASLCIKRFYEVRS